MNLDVVTLYHRDNTEQRLGATTATRSASAPELWDAFERFFHIRDDEVLDGVQICSDENGLYFKARISAK